MVGVLWLLKWFDAIGSLNVLCLSVEEILVGVFVVYQSFKSAPGFVKENFGLWEKLWGRAVVFITFGSLNLNFDGDTLIWLCGAVNVGLGIAYLVANFVPACCKPEPACGGDAPPSA